MSNPFATHAVLNQSPPFEDVNLFASDSALVEAVKREGASHAVERLTDFGSACGSAEALQRGRTANENPPRLRTFDSKGRRLDMVEFHPAYHECMAAQHRRGPALLGVGPSGDARSATVGRAPTWRAPPAPTWPSRWRPATSAPSP